MERQTAEQLLRLLAKAGHECSIDRGAAFSALRQASALLWQLAPESAPMRPLDLEKQLSIPIETWLPESVRGGYEGPLLSSHFTTQTCSEMLFEMDIRELWEETQAIVRKVRDSCRLRKGGQQLYRNFRLFLIQNAVIKPAEAQKVLVPLGLAMTDIYSEIPAHLIQGGQVFLCPSCGWPMDAMKDEVHCDSSWCKHNKSVFLRQKGHLINRHTSARHEGVCADGLWMLQGALWKFTLLPGRLELGLAEALTSKGFAVELWPEFDRVDLQVVVGPQTFDIDAKVWRSVHSLAERIKLLRPTAPLWIVVPDYQKHHVRFLRESCPPCVEVFTQAQCVKELVKRANPF
ncbi:MULTISPECIES: hypothetical protein [Pseudomonas]|uniref:restriction endonuclease-related protein n=1 Tax=Pseudomonas TaxID=286 RepID=UPI0009300843|nr:MULTISPECIES: hypothetical protein [Pseudomonas]NHN68237.1 hypothetical protein [Pseudomonas fluorescens]RML93233.1 hypothetical protein ALQ87_05390 [Pseudomonas savastanoi pv. glycinea]